MSEIVGFVALSHSPFWDRSFDVSGAGAEFVAGVAHAKQMVTVLAPDLVVVFGPDHYRNFFLDSMPAFCISAGEIQSFGDYGTYRGPIATEKAASEEIVAGLYRRGFDPAFSLRMGVDHGITQPYQVLLQDQAVPAIAVMINCAAAPRPELRRVHELGAALGDAIRALPGDRRVLVLASGGLSHWVATPAADEADADMREFLIDGRSVVRAYNAKREQSVADRAERGAEGRVIPEWDRWFLSCLQTGNLDPVLALTSDEIESAAGNGAHEVRCWLAGAAAWGGSVSVLAYEPVPTWSTGMGVIAGKETAK